MPSEPDDGSAAREEARHQRMLARLRLRAARQFPLHEVTLPIRGTREPYRIALPADPDGPLDQIAAWQAHFAAGSTPTLEGERDPMSPHAGGAAQVARRAVARGIHLPYWAVLWPSGMALAESILAERGILASRRALELGCGLGVTATAALQAGASLVAADCFADALLYCRYNTLRNAGRVPSTLLLDWRSPAGRDAAVARGPFDVVLAADVLYEADDEAPLLDLAARLLAPGGLLWLAEPGRRVALSFVAAARARGWHDEPATYESVWPTDKVPTRVTIHRFHLP